MELKNFIETHQELRNMCSQIERLQIKKHEFELERDSEVFVNPYPKMIDYMFFDIIELLFKELNVDQNFGDLRDNYNDLDDAVVEVLFADGDIMNVFDELDAIEIAG